jgi:hypothetical protein
MKLLSIRTQTLTDIFLVIFSSVLLCYMAFYNGFPLVFSDCGAYILSGFSLNVPLGRPIFYGLFIRHISMLTSLWAVIWVQGIIISLIVFYWFKYLSGNENFRFYYLGYIFLITFFTGASVNVSQLIPDIFTPVVLLCTGLLLFASKMKIRDVIITTIILIYGIAVHNSHYLIVGIVLLIITLAWTIRIFREQLKSFALSFRRILYIWAVLAFSYLMVCTVHYSLGAGFKFSRTGHIFMMSRLVDMGIADRYLNDNCDKYHFKLCEYRNQFPTLFLWDVEKSPLYKTGGWLSETNKEEYSAIIRDIMTTPKYLHLYIIKTIESTAKQLFCFETGDTPKQVKDSPSYYAISKHFPVSLREYTYTKQNYGTLNVNLLNEKQKYLVVFSLFLSILFLLLPQFPVKFKWFISFILFGLIANAFICAAVSVVVHRYQSRVIWLLPLPLVLYAANRQFLVPFFQKLFPKTNPPENL